MEGSTRSPQRSFFWLSIVFPWPLMLVFFAVPDASVALDIYVSVDGGAQADGSLVNPYGSLADAVKAVRALREAGHAEPARVILRKGRHQLNRTLVLGIGDGAPKTSDDVAFVQYGAGEPTSPDVLTFAAYPGEHPVVSGGIPVTGWKRLESVPADLPAEAVGKVWVADMPAGIDRFYTLYDSRGRLSRARNAGFSVTKRGDLRTLHFPKGALKNWDNLEDVEIQIRPSRAWVINMLPLASVDEDNGVAKTSVSATYDMSPLPGWVHNPSGANVWVENILEALNEPGEWVLNTKTRKVYLWPSDPAPNGSPQGILAPSISELIRVEGVIDYDGPEDTPVRGIAFSGLTFSHADRWAWTTDETRLGWGMQHDWDMFDRPTATLRFRGAEDCRVTNCRFVSSGGTGLRLDLHAQRNRILDCEFAHLGEAGIVLAGYGPGTKDANHHNEIVNNYIHHFSEITWHSPGLWAWQSGHNRIVHNELYHSGYSAVLITTRVEPDRSLNGEGGRTVRRHEIAAEDKNRPRGGYESWKTREQYNHARHNLFEYNEISHSVQLLSDGNGIYVSGTGTGNIVRYNYLHDNLAHSLPAAIRCDDDQHETLIYGNVLYNNAGFSAGIASKGVNDIINNFIVDPAVVPKSGYISFEWVPVTGSKVRRNIIVSHPGGGRAHNERLRGKDNGGRPVPKLVDTEMDKNLYYHPTDSHWMDEHLLKMRAVGQEKASLVGDPLFVDPAAGDFRFQEDSPALELGIEPLDVSKMGRRDKGANSQTITIEDRMQWFQDAKFGMFIHFGVDRKSEFNPIEFDAGQWVRIAKDAGMKYIVLTTKHHVGFCLWDSELTDWNVVDQTPFGRDIVKELAAACEAEGLEMGCYYSIADYHHPLYEPKYQNRPERRRGTVPGADITKYIDFMFGQIEELCELYHPCLIWFDGGSGFRHPDHKPLLRRQELVDMLHSYGTICNSRLGDDDPLLIVDYLSMNDNMAPAFSLGVCFESAVTIGNSWHFSSQDDELKSPQALLERLINAAGNGGNLLLNVGPDDEGVIPAPMVSRLTTMGDWLKRNGEAIYGTEAGPYPYEISWGTITQRKEEDCTSLYLNVVEWPKDGTFTLFGVNNPVLNASLLATGEALEYETKVDAPSGHNIITLEVPKSAPDEYVSVIKLVVSGAVSMDLTFMQLGDGKVVMGTYNATIHDLEPVPNKPAKAIDMKMYTVPQSGEGIMPGRGLTISGFQTRGQALSWDFRVFRPGTYEVVVVCHSGRNQRWNVQGRVRANVAGQSVENELIESQRVTTPTMNSGVVDLHSALGTVEINSPGAHTLTLEVATDLTGAKPKFRAVMLTPVTQDERR